LKARKSNPREGRGGGGGAVRGAVASPGTQWGEGGRLKSSTHAQQQSRGNVGNCDRTKRVSSQNENSQRRKPQMRRTKDTDWVEKAKGPQGKTEGGGGPATLNIQKKNVQSSR